MTLSPIRLALTSLLLCVLVSGGRGGALAEDPPAATAAEQAFKDAWWAETGGGNLNEALALYEKAAAAEGPAPVRAKALYRRAIVLQRIGKTEDAIRTLERLAKEHPGETALQSDARARLEEWTAIDLRTGFPEWYRRFQYGPEFQAKVLDLVLKLGSPSNEEQRSAERELLTIGEPSVGALRAHLGSRSEPLRQHALKVLLLLGIVPDELATLGLSWETAQRSEIWGLLLDLPAERRAALRARVVAAKPADAQHTAALLAVLDGPEAVLAWLARLQPASPNVTDSRGPVWWALRRRIPTPSPLAEQVRSELARGLQDPLLWSWMATWTIEKGLVTRADVDAWARMPGSVAITPTIEAALDPRLFAPKEGLEVFLAVIASSPNSGMGPWVLEQLTKLTATLPWPESRDTVARAILDVWPNVRRSGQMSFPAGVQLLDALTRAIELATDDKTIAELMEWWQGRSPVTPEAVAFVERMLKAGVREGHRQQALQVLITSWPQSEKPRVLALLLDPEATALELMRRWALLRQWQHGPELLRDPKVLTQLLERHARVAADPNVDRRVVRDLGARLLDWAGTSAASAPFLASWLREPELWRHVELQGIQLHNLNKSLVQAGDLPGLRARFMERWAATSKEGREALLSGLEVLNDGESRSSAEMEPFWRNQLRARPSTVPERWSSYVLSQLRALTLDDLRAVYDFADPGQADNASASVAQIAGSPQPPRVAPSREAFEALRIVFRPEGPMARQFAEQLRKVPGLDAELLPLLIASKEWDARAVALDILHDRSDPADQDLWTRALRDEKPVLRQRAAKAIVRVPTPATQKALVAALDDPHPDVRAAALESLDAIQKMEDLKARWREKVK